jgi:hypothetical protein
MSNTGVLDRAAGLLDAAGRDPDGVLPPTAATRSLQAADELHRAGARPVLEGDPMPPAAAIREALRAAVCVTGRGVPHRRRVELRRTRPARARRDPLIR